MVLVASLLGLLTQAGPVGYYKGDDTPPMAIDSSPNARNGVYTNGATTNPSKPAALTGTSMSFDGVDDLVSETTFPWPTGGPVTVAFWNFVPTGSVQNSSAFTVGNMDNANRFHVHGPWGDSVLYWDYGDINANGRISANYASRVNAWTHVALVSEGVGGAFKAIYFDGTVAASATNSNGPVVALTGLQIGSWTGPALRHKGLIDDFRIYGRVLTPAQIQLLAQGGTEPTTAPVVNMVVTTGTADLSWAAVPNAVSYTIERSVAGGAFTQIASVTGTSYTDSGLTPGVIYSYRVTPVSVSAGPVSNTVSDTIPFPPPRTNDHGEGLFDDKCACGSSAPGTSIPWALLPIALLAFLRRR
ncbi:MAG TPA: LamG-like jellyroll fold domain-containing protein [Planctomycetota bacterium]